MGAGGGGAGNAAPGGDAASTGGALPRTRLKSAFARSLFLTRSASATTWTGRSVTRAAGVNDGEARSAEAGVSARRRSKMLWSLTSATKLIDKPVPKGRIGKIEAGERGPAVRRLGPRLRWRCAGGLGSGKTKPRASAQLG